MKLTLEECKNRMDEYGNIYLSGCTSLTTLPEGLTVGGSLYLSGCTGLTTLPEGLTVGGSLYLSDCTGLTSLPEGLTVGGSLYLRGCTGLTTLPEGLTVGGSLDLRGCTGLTTLPEGLTVGGWLDLRGCTSLTSLPEGLTVGGSLYLSGCTGLTSLPEGLTVGGSLDLRGCTSLTGYKNYKPHKLKDGDYVAERYIYCDGILTHVRTVKKVDKYTVYVGKIPRRNVVSDGTHYAHCDKLRDGIADLAFKTASDRGADQYRGMSLDTELTVPEAVTMYRIITGACRQGSEQFVKSLGKLKAKYTIRECLEITKGQYNADKFAMFFGEE